MSTPEKENPMSDQTEKPRPNRARRRRAKADRARGWYWENYSEEQLTNSVMLHATEVEDFLHAITGLEWDELTTGERRLLSLVNRAHTNWFLHKHRH